MKEEQMENENNENLNEMNIWKIKTPQRIGNKLLVTQKKAESMALLEKKEIDAKTEGIKEQLRKEREEELEK